VSSDGDDCRHLPLDQKISRWGRLSESRLYPGTERERRVTAFRVCVSLCAGISYTQPAEDVSFLASMCCRSRACASPALERSRRRPRGDARRRTRTSHHRPHVLVHVQVHGTWVMAFPFDVRFVFCGSRHGHAEIEAAAERLKYRTYLRKTAFYHCFILSRRLGYSSRTVHCSVCRYTL
jgi:hypothetical protein